MCVCMFTPPPPPYKHTCQLPEPKFLFKSKSRKTLMSQLKVVREGISLTHGRVNPFVLCRLSTDWMKPTPLERATCFTWLTGLNGNHHSGLNGNHHSGLDGNHHSGLNGNHHSGLNGNHHSGLDGNRHSGLNGNRHSGLNGNRHSGLNGNRHSGLDENPFRGGLWLRR